MRTTEKIDLQSGKRLGWHFRLASLVIICLGFALRLHKLGGDSFWIDEILTVQDAVGGLESILNIRDHPPLLYALTSLNNNLFGQGEFAARLAPFLAGVLALPLLMLLGRLMGRPAAGLWAAFLLALSSVHMALSQTARHYALLATISLATYLLLYLALKRPRLSTWLIFAILTALNLYTHYGSLIVLAGQVLLIVAWLSVRVIQGERRPAILLLPMAAGVGVMLLFLPWLSRFQLALKVNTGAEVLTDTGSATPLIEWLRTVWLSFGLIGTLYPFALSTLALLGLLLLLRQRNWLEAGLLIMASLGSLALISLFQVARSPTSRYISFILPFYLLSAGIALAAILQATVSRIPGKYGRVVSAGLALLLLVIAWPGLRQEYVFVLEDWRNVLAYLDQQAGEDDVLLGLSLNYRRGFNLVDASLPYYLRELGEGYVYLPGNTLEYGELMALRQTEKDIWVVIFDWNVPTALTQSTLEFTPFQSNLFVARDREQQGPTLERLKDLYTQLIPLAPQWPQRCLLHRDSAAISAAIGDWRRIDDELAFMEESCPEIIDDPLTKGLNRPLLAGKLDHLLQTGQEEEIFHTAEELLTLDRKNMVALHALTAVDLGRLFSDSMAVISDEASPEPVRLLEFTMPHNGDWGEVLLVHPPASVSYTLTLPEETVAFRTRLAQAPDSWAWGGDGATYVLRIQRVGEEPVELFRQHIGNSEGDHDWHEVNISLAGYAGQTVTLTLTTETGPAGDGTGDWAGWETPRLMWISPRGQK